MRLVDDFLWELFYQDIRNTCRNNADSLAASTSEPSGLELRRTSIGLGDLRVGQTESTIRDGGNNRRNENPFDRSTNGAGIVSH